MFTIGVFCNPLGEVVGGWENVTVALEHYFVKTLKSDLFQVYLVYFTGLTELCLVTCFVPSKIYFDWLKDNWS